MVFSILHCVLKFVSDLWQVIGFLYTTLCDKVCQWLATGQWFSLYYCVLKFVSDLLQVNGFLYTTLCDKVCQWLATGQWFSLGTLVSSTYKMDCHNITEILLKVALNTIILTLTHYLQANRPNIQDCMTTYIHFRIAFTRIWVLYKRHVKFLLCSKELTGYTYIEILILKLDLV